MAVEKALQYRACVITWPETLLSLMRAAAVVKRQSAVAYLVFRRLNQAATSCFKVCGLAMRLLRHCAHRTANSDSAMSSQLPCLGV